MVLQDVNALAFVEILKNEKKIKKIHYQNKITIIDTVEYQLIHK